MRSQQAEAEVVVEHEAEPVNPEQPVEVREGVLGVWLDAPPMCFEESWRKLRQLRQLRHHFEIWMSWRRQCRSRPAQQPRLPPLRRDREQPRYHGVFRKVHCALLAKK